MGGVFSITTSLFAAGAGFDASSTGSVATDRVFLPSRRSRSDARRVEEEEVPATDGVIPSGSR